MKILVFSFEPFGKDTLNSSEEAIKLLPADIDGIEIVKHCLPVSFSRSVTEAISTVESHNPILILCLGQAAGRATVSLERIAVNIANANNPDVDGFKPLNKKLCTSGTDRCMTKFPVDSLSERLRMNGYPCFVSNSAGTYVCNCLYYNLLHRFPKLPTLFIHLPLTPEQTATRPFSTPSLAPATAAATISELIVLSIRKQETSLQNTEILCNTIIYTGD